MSSQLFVSRSALLALADSAHPEHARAAGFLGHLDGPIVTSNVVLLEVVGAVDSLAGHAKAVELLERLRGEKSLKLYHVDAEIERRGWEIYTRDAGIDPGIAMNIALMRELGIRMAFTFEAAYRSAGFLIVPMTGER